jgi:hypothetical protein
VTGPAISLKDDGDFAGKGVDDAPGNDVGPHYVHGNMLTDPEFDLIAESGGTLTITPGSGSSKTRSAP